MVGAAAAWAQTEQENTPPGLNVKRDSAGQIVVNGLPTQQPAPAQIEPTTEPLVPAKERYGAVEVLSDTHGVNVGPYVRDYVLPAVRSNWHSAIPASAQTKTGKAAIEFAIKKDGRVAGIRIVASSGVVTLDRAAWAGITSSDPFPSLPVEFNGEYLRLRFRFFYNPDKAELAEARATAPAPTIVHAKLKTNDPDSRLPKYPKKARQERTEGLVRLDVDVSTDGRVKNLKVLEGDPLLADASVHAVRQWRFYAAEKDGRPFESGRRSESIFDWTASRSALRSCHIPNPLQAVHNSPGGGTC